MKPFIAEELPLTGDAAASTKHDTGGSTSAPSQQDAFSADTETPLPEIASERGMDAIVDKESHVSDGESVARKDTENGLPSSLWCRVELHNHTEWAECATSNCPAFRLNQRDQGQASGSSPLTQPNIQGVNVYSTSPHPPGRPAHGMHEHYRRATGQKGDKAMEDDQSKSPSSARCPRPDVGYRNKFLDYNDVILVNERWPGAMDVESERGKALGSTAPGGNAIVELVTVVRTEESVGMSRGIRLPPPMPIGLPRGRPRFANTWSILSDPTTIMGHTSKEVFVDSLHLVQFFNRIVTYYPYLDLKGINMTIREPFCLFYHHLDDIKAYQHTYTTPEDCAPGIDACNEDTYEHLRILREVIEGQNLQDVEQEIERHHQSPPVATYPMLWLLYKPGRFVYHFNGERATVGIIQSVNIDTESRKSGIISVEFWNLDFDGFKLGRCQRELTLKPFDGEREIKELELCPCDMYDAQDGFQLRQRLILRGKKYWKFLSGFQVEYNGILPMERTKWQGRVIIDPATYYRFAPVDENEDDFREELQPPTIGNVQDSMYTRMRRNSRSRSRSLDPYRETRAERRRRKRREARVFSKYGEGPWTEYENIIPETTRSLELISADTKEKDMSRYLLCPQDVIGFDLKTRRWLLLDVGCCEEVAFNEDAINHLVMEEERKILIKSLVNRYARGDVDGKVVQRKVSQPWTADFIKNKGDGQIFLLHGSPGVGKTYTAECIAEATRRPLLSLTCGDFGTNETTVEQRLSKWFQLAEHWGAVLLLDEADVFLERRQLADLQRNSLVSIFLRTMEYYRGILFLTTNRVGHFDDAFVSRIHTIIHYENFSQSDRERIWKQFFTKLETERRKSMRVDPGARKYVLHSEDMTKINWNGREIRNAFQTAVAFAEYRFLELEPEDKEEGEKACLEAQDFEKVFEMTGAFKKYLASISGADEFRRARQEGSRNDSYRDGYMGNP